MDDFKEKLEKDDAELYRESMTNAYLLITTSTKPNAKRLLQVELISKCFKIFKKKETKYL